MSGPTFRVWFHFNDGSKLKGYEGDDWDGAMSLAQLSWRDTRINKIEIVELTEQVVALFDQQDQDLVQTDNT